MASCESYLRKAVFDIEPSRSQKAGAVRSHNYLRDRLQQGHFKDRIIGTYLSGSYARDTAIAPLDDVDIIFLIDASYWNSPLLASRPRPKELLQSFARAVRLRYRDSSVRLQRRSVCLQLSHISLDIVPGIEVSKGSTLIEIPDRDSDTWIRTNPRSHSEYSSKINQANGKRLKPIVKLLKFWNSKLPSTARLKSFAIETMATRLFEHERITSIQEGLLLFFDFIAHLGHQPTHFQWRSRYKISLRFSAVLQDASGISNLLANTDGEKIDRFISQSVRSRNLLLKADDAARQTSAWGHAAKALRFPY